MQMKKMVIISLMINFAVLAFCQGTDELDRSKISAEEKNLKSVLAINIGYLFPAFRNGRIGFGLGGMYERSLNNYFSMLIEGGGIWYKQKDSIEYLQLDITGYGRFYPQGNSLAKFFIGLGTGYSFISIKYDGNAEGSHLYKIIPEFGYKFVFEYTVLELGLGYRFKFGEINYPNGVIGNSNESYLSNIHYRIIGGFRLR
jgi:hypothetical protein